MPSEKEIDKLRLIIYLIALVAVIGAFLGIPTHITELAIQWLVSVFIGLVFSLVAGSLVEAFTGDLLKTITLTIPIKGFNISISAFAIATFIVKVWLFGF